MKLFKVLVVLAFAVAIFGTAGFFAYQLYFVPTKLDKADEKAAEAAKAAPATPPPDYSLPAFEKVIALAQQGPSVEARDALVNFIVQYPQSTRLADAKKALGDINTQFVFTSMPGPDKIDYTVVSGDSLVRVATRTKSNAELILRSNNLASIDLQIGQQLRVPQLEPSLVLNRSAQTISLLNRGQLFKEYPILSLQLPGAAKGTEPVETTVKDKVAIRGSERVAFGSKDYVGSDRWLMLGLPNAIIRGLPDTEDGSAPATMPPGVVVSQEDIEEIFPLVSRGTPVIIQ